MLDYTALKDIANEAMRKRTIQGLQSLCDGLDSQIPAKTVSGNLLLATWNIRELDAGKFGYRSLESYYYIAEIVSRFDVIAIQEVRENLYPLHTLKKLLGKWWAFMVTDVTLGNSGNSERMAYLYDTRKVSFSGLAAELVLPKTDKDSEVLQLARSPYIAGFQAGNAYFSLVTVHIYYGEDNATDARRLKEITDLANTIAKYTAHYSMAPTDSPDKTDARSDLFLLGDFNIFNRKDVTMQAILKAGFVVPPALQQIPGSNVDKDRHYDQIAYYKALQSLSASQRAGVFDFYQYVFKDEALYSADRASKPARSFKEWRSYRMSDHLPMWLELGIDDSKQQLQQ